MNQTTGEKSVSGLVFDIRRFSVHDGDGIRTTLFLKGCPLRCKWCQNPEGLSSKRHLLYFKNKCISCGACVSICPTKAISLKEGGGIAIDRTACNLNFACADICPAVALAPDSREITALQAVEEAMSDAPFFRHGGGVTVSGGEPFSQPEFLLELLRRLKKKGVHTAVETSLFTPPETFEKTLPFIDLLFADCKILDDEGHTASTGVSNQIILQNLRTALKTPGQRVIVRTPLIPGFTATEENITQIASFLASVNPDTEYELLNYNPLAKGKYDLVEQEYCFEENPPLYTEAEMERFRSYARAAGLSHIITA